MIHHILIRNFKCHKRLSIKLDPHVTTIVGPSDAGKSAILRAFTWAMRNRPQGNKFIRKGAKYASVFLTLEKGHKLARSRGEQGNEYHLDGKDFRAFGNDVPQEISDLLKVTDINFQTQLDILHGTGPPFWFSLAPGDIAKKLNQIVDLSLIDTTMGNLSKATRRVSSERSVCESRLKQARHDRDKLKPIERTHRELVALEGLQRDLSLNVTRGTRIASYLAQGETLKAQVKHLTTGLIRARSVTKLGQTWKKTAERVTYLEELVAQGDNLQHLIESSIPDLSPLERVAERLTAVTKSIETLSGIIGRGRWCQESLRWKQEELEKVTKKLKKEMGDRCQLCGNRIRSSLLPQVTSI